jgi:hypothetical protein
MGSSLNAYRTSLSGGKETLVPLAVTGKKNGKNYDCGTLAKPGFLLSSPFCLGGGSNNDVWPRRAFRFPWEPLSIFSAEAAFYFTEISEFHSMGVLKRRFFLLH